MSKDKTLKLALEALQLVSIEFVCNGAHHAKKDRHDWLESCPIVDRYQAAITAIREALEQPEQGPVAWMHEWADGERIPLMHGRDDRNNDEPVSVRPLVFGDTTPPLPVQRPWVGLTDEEMTKIYQDTMWGTSIYWFADAIEAKLKEKNT